MGVVAWLRSKLSAARRRAEDPARAEATAFIEYAAGRHFWIVDRCVYCGNERTLDNQDGKCPRRA